MRIDINYEFTDDSSIGCDDVWKIFWKDDVQGEIPFEYDPDGHSLVLQQYHKTLWSKKLPNGQFMNLKEGKDCKLIWEEENMEFSSDWFINTFLHWKRCRKTLEDVKREREYYGNYKSEMEDFTKRTYTIGAMMIFPTSDVSINTERGLNNQICDRADLTLECIRRFYDNKYSPLQEVLEKERKFFEFFVDFKGYVDFFFLNDLVSDDYNSVKSLIQNNEEYICDIDFGYYPANASDWLKWQENSEKFIYNRSQLIRNYCISDLNFDNYTDTAINVLLCAREEARQMGHNFIGTEQLLLGIFAQESGIAKKCLTEFGYDVSKARIATLKTIGTGSFNFRLNMPMTPRAKLVLYNAQHSIKPNFKKVTSGHILLSILEEIGSCGFQVLKRLNIDKFKLEEYIEAMLSTFDVSNIE